MGSRGVESVDGTTVCVAVVGSSIEAELLAGILRSHGLNAVVSADDAGGQYPQVQMGGVRVLVAPPRKPWPVGSWPPPMTSPDRTAAAESDLPENPSGPVKGFS